MVLGIVGSWAKTLAFFKCGFDLFITIVQTLSPQLGGVFCDLQDYVKSLKINDGEPVMEFYLRALQMSQEITLQQDKTGQNMIKPLNFLAMKNCLVLLIYK